MNNLLKSFIPRLQYAVDLEACLQSGDYKESVKYAEILMGTWFTPPTNLERQRHAQGVYLGPVRAQYILMEELIAAIEELLQQQASALPAITGVALQPRLLQLVRDPSAA